MDESEVVRLANAKSNCQAIALGLSLNGRGRRWKKKEKFPCLFKSIQILNTVNGRGGPLVTASRQCARPLFRRGVVG